MREEERRALEGDTTAAAATPPAPRFTGSMAGANAPPSISVCRPVSGLAVPGRPPSRHDDSGVSDDPSPAYRCGGSRGMAHACARALHRIPV